MSRPFDDDEDGIDRAFDRAFEAAEREDLRADCPRCRSGLARDSHTCGGGGSERSGEPRGRE